MTVAGDILTAALASGRQITTAESCTGGMVAAAITDIPGSSGIFERGFVTYSNIAKQQMLGVSAKVLADHGAVSEQVAAQMAEGALRAAQADIAVAITGIAGPGGSEFKPEGRVCYGLASASGVQTLTMDHGALGRDAVRSAATAQALKLLLDALTAA